MEEPNISRLVFKRGIDVAGNPPPVPGRQRRVAALQMAVPDPPNVARLKEEELSSDHGDGVEVRLAGVGLERGEAWMLSAEMFKAPAWAANPAARMKFTG